MRSLYIFLAIVLSSFSVAAQQGDPFFVTDTIPTAEAKNNMGKYFTFCDEISGMHTVAISGKPTMISLGTGEGVLTLVIWAADEKDNFDRPVKELYKVGDKICVQGQITSHQGGTRLEVGTPRQISKWE